MELPEQPKPSFFGSVMSGIGGWFKGLFYGGLVGAVGGAIIGAGVAVVAGLLGPGVALGAVGAFALTGAGIGASALAGLGAMAGAFTGVMKSREAAQPSAAALTGALSMAHQHGQMVGQQQGYAIAQQQNQKTKSWQDAERVRDQARTAVTGVNT